MKLLLESWNKHLNENVTKEQLEQTIQKILNWCGDKTIATELAQNIPVLKDSYIVKRLGSGQNGIAYELSNGNVLKLYTGGNWLRRSKVETENEEYKSIMNKMFGGKSFRGEIAVYSSGIYRSNPESTFPMDVGWAELNKVTTLSDYYNLLNVPPHIVEDKKNVFDTLCEDISSFLYQKFVQKDDDYYDAMEMFDQSFHNSIYVYKEALTNKEIIAFKTGLFKFYKQHQYNPSLDVHFQNCGLMWPSDLTSFVVFDY